MKVFEGVKFKIEKENWDFILYAKEENKWVFLCKILNMHHKKFEKYVKVIKKSDIKANQI